ncbi:MAG: proline dehydrogenase family protein [bacterium]
MAGIPAASIEGAGLEAEIRSVGMALAEGEASASGPLLQRLDERAMRHAAQDRELRAALFRLVDVAPACRNFEDLGEHLAGLVGQLDERPPSLDVAMRTSHTKAGRIALGAATAAGVRHMAHRFIAGDSPTDARAELLGLWRSGIASTIDLLGEASVAGAEADRYRDRCAEAIAVLAEGAQGWPRQGVLESDSQGAIPRANLSVKVSALTPMLRPEAPERAIEDASARLRPLLSQASRSGAHLHIDMEDVDSLESTMRLVLELLSSPEFERSPSAGLVLQAYLCESPALLDQILDWARASRRSPPLVVRLVKGAYWDSEVVEARQQGWSVPVFTDKAECDRNFEALTRRLLDARPAVRVAVGSHNLRSVAHAIAYNRFSGGDDRDLEFQVLRGLGDDLAAALAAAGLRARLYSPVGDLVAGMAYLVRRLLENTSNESFLGARLEGEEIEALLAAP